MAEWTKNLLGKNFGICLNFGTQEMPEFTIPYQQDLELPQSESIENEETIHWKPQFKGDTNTSYTITSNEQKYTASFSCLYDPYNESFKQIGIADDKQSLVYFSIVNVDLPSKDPNFTIAYGSCTIRMGTKFPLEGQNTVDIELTVQGKLHRIGVNDLLTVKYVVGVEGKTGQDKTYENLKYKSKTPEYKNDEGKKIPEPYDSGKKMFSHWAKDEETKNNPDATVDPYVFGDVVYNAIFKSI